MKRLDNWEVAMNETIAAHTAMDGSWGVSDCFRFPTQVAAAIVGQEPIFKTVKYSTEIGAAKSMKSRGFNSIGDVFASEFPEAPLMTFRRGDIGVTNIGGIERGCVITGSGLAIKGMNGIEIAPIDQLTRLFKVGE